MQTQHAAPRVSISQHQQEADPAAEQGNWQPQSSNRSQQPTRAQRRSVAPVVDSWAEDNGVAASEDADVPLQKCKTCRRGFNQRALAVHERVCLKVKILILTRTTIASCCMSRSAWRFQGIDLSCQYGVKGSFRDPRMLHRYLQARRTRPLHKQQESLTVEDLCCSPLHLLMAGRIQRPSPKGVKKSANHIFTCNAGAGAFAVMK